MKHILLSAFMLLSVAATAIAQDLSSKSQQELEKMKEQAVKEQNFTLAEKVKAELQSRKTIDELINEKKVQLKDAVNNSEFTKADELKNEINSLEKAKFEIKTLEEQLNIAVKQENYAEAQRLKVQIEQLKNPGVKGEKQEEQLTKSAYYKTASASTGEVSKLGSKFAFLANYKVAVGITGGDFSFTDASGNGMEAEIGPSLGYFLGLSKDYNFGESIVFQPGVALVGFGAQANGEYTWSIHYLSLNGNVQYRTAFKLYAAGGLFLDYGLFGSQGYPSGNSVSPFDNNGLTRLNTGINTELGYPINIGEKQADVFVSYRIGVNNMEGEDAEVGQTTKARMFTIGLRYAF